MTQKLPDVDTPTPLSPLLHAGWASDNEQQHMFMRLRRARSANDVICQLVVGTNRDYSIRFDTQTEPAMHDARIWVLYLSITRLQGRALEQAIRAELVTPAYLLRKASTFAVHPGYLQVPLPCYVRETIEIPSHHSNNDQCYRLLMERSLRNPKLSALVCILDENEQLVVRETVPGAVSPVRQQTVQRFIEGYTDQAELYTRNLLRQIDAASAAVLACLE